MPSRLGRLLRPADFERLLKQPSCARSPLFAVHHMACEPSQPAKPVGKGLSTGGEQLTHRLVDESPEACPTQPSPPAGHWLGFVVPKRLAKRAVTRNLVRRMARASLEAQLAGPQPLPPGIWALRLRAPIDRQLKSEVISTAPQN